MIVYIATFEIKRKAGKFILLNSKMAQIIQTQILQCLTSCSRENTLAKS